MSVYCVYYEVDWLLTLCVEGWRGRSSQLGGVVAGSEAHHGHRNGRWRGESNRDVYCLVSTGRVPARGELVVGRLDWREQKKYSHLGQGRGLGGTAGAGRPTTHPSPRKPSFLFFQ